MTAPVNVRVQLVPEGLVEVTRDPRVGRQLLEIAKRTVVPAARGLAPQRTGAGAASIDAVLKPAENGAWEVHISWARSSWYMRFQDTGTVHLKARRFMERAAEQYGGHAIAKQGGSTATPRRRRKKPSSARSARYVVTRPDGSSYAGTRSAARSAIKAAGG